MDRHARTWTARWRRRIGRNADRRLLRRLTAAIALTQVLGCGGRDTSVSIDQIALLEPTDSVRIDSVDGFRARLVYRGAGLSVAPGPHTIRVRRRVASSKPAAAPAPSGPDDGSLEHTGYLLEGFCALNFDASAGARYVVSTAAPVSEGAPWTASLRGAGVDVSCISRDPLPLELVGRTRYLCCNMTFLDGETTDANYRYTGTRSAQLPTGTRVVVTEVRRDRIAFRAEPDGEVYRVYLEYGRFNTDPETYFTEILREHDPRAAAPGKSTADLAAAALAPGMTREQAILVRGYPPLHRTPDRQAAEWLYYESAGRGTYVTFADGVITTVREAAAP